MGSDAAVNVQAPQNSSAVKVHSPMCWELTNILNKVICILPVIESAQPGFTSGIQELCSLNNAVEKAKLLIQHCTESSKLYLAITGESILLRCERIRSAINHSLCEIESMVPPVVVAKIYDVLDHLRDSKFTIDLKEEEAGKALLQLLGQTNSSEELELTAFQIAAVKLNITSPKAILIERRSIKKLLDKISGTDQKKERILKYFLNLLRKYGKKVRPDISEHEEVSNTDDNVLISNTISTPDDTKFEKNDEPTNLVDSQTDLSCIDVPPEEFCCPISSRLMYDPVVIASGQTYERILIEKWFNDGKDTCPKTQKKLANLSVIPNSCMKDLISNWCRKHGIDLEDPSKAFRSWESSCCSSISSLKNVPAALLEGAAGDYLFQSDHSSVSFISSDASSCSHVSHIKGIDTLKGMDNHVQLFSWSDDYSRCQSFSDFNHDMYMRFFYGLSELPLNLQDKAVADVEVLLGGDEETCYAMLSNGFVEALMMFLKNVHDLSDVQALKVGAQLFLAFLSNNRVEVPSLSEDAFQLLTSFLESEITTEALMILQKLCHHPNSKSIVPVAGVPPIIKFLDSEDSEFLELAIKILHDLSSQSEIKPLILSSGCIPKLVPLLGDRRLAEFCLKIMRNLSDIEEAAQLLAETNGCLPSVAELLDSRSPEEQEHAVIILLSLCSHSFENCLLVMKEGVIPSLVDISVNGSPQGKESSTKLLRLLRDLRHNVESDCFDSLQPKSGSMGELVEDSVGHSTKKQPNPKSFGFFARKMKLLAKPRS